MVLQFQSLRSSSSGNCLLVRTDHTAILLDCGIKTQHACRHLLSQHLGSPPKLHAVVVSHAHGDHICYSALRVLGDQNIPIHCHGEVVQQIQDKHVGDWDSPPRLRPFSCDSFQIGDVELQPIELPHAPDYPTFGFVIRAGRKKIVVATDFHQPEAVARHLADADFIFVEANHDLELLRQHWNPSSLFHLSNPKTAQLLCQARKHRCRPPQVVMLGHLSKQRNTDELAIAAVRERFGAEGVALDFRLEVAPRYVASEVIGIQ